MATNDTTKKQETAEEIRKAHSEERIDYIARRPIGTDPKETDVTVTVNGINYRVQYGKNVKIPRFVAEVLDRAYAESEKIFNKVSDLSKSRKLADY